MLFYMRDDRLSVAEFKPNDTLVAVDMASLSLATWWFPYSHISHRNFTVKSSPSPPVTSVGPNDVPVTDASAKVIDGKVAKQIRDEMIVEVSRMKEVIDVIPR